MDMARKQYAQWEKPDTEDFMLYNSLYPEYQEEAYLFRGKVDWQLFKAGLGGSRGGNF